LAGSFTPTGSTTPTIVQTLSPCGPLATNLDFCARSTSFTPAKLNGTWDATFQNPAGTATETFALPSTVVIPATPVPFPKSVTITNSANGINPTISWQLPTGFTPDAFRINIFDRSTSPLANGQDNIIHSVIIPPATTSYTLPTVLSSGEGLVAGDKYSINFQVINTRDGGPDSNNSQADILTRSNSYFDFTPVPGSTTPSPSYSPNRRPHIRCVPLTDKRTPRRGLV
jgi:hypothetical protein